MKVGAIGFSLVDRIIPNRGPSERHAVIELGAVPECEPIAAFLFAEIDSSRYGAACILPILRSMGRARTLIDRPDVASVQENADRRTVLARYRGYPDQLLFGGFPRDATWYRVRLEPGDFSGLRYANVPLMQQLSGGTLLVKDGASNLLPNPPAGLEHIPGVLAELRNGRLFPPLLVVEGPGVPLTLLEGHSRATAYFIEGKTMNVDAFVARSPTMSRWIWK